MRSSHGKHNNSVRVGGPIGFRRWDVTNVTKRGCVTPGFCGSYRKRVKEITWLKKL